MKAQTIRRKPRRGDPPASKGETTRARSARAKTAAGVFSPRDFRFALGIAALLAVISIAASRWMAWPADEPSIHLFVLYDGIGAVPLFFGCLLAACALFDPRAARFLHENLRALGRHPERAALAFFLIAAVLALPIYQGTALSYDEYTEIFQAKIFASFHWQGLFPRPLISRLAWPTQNYFLSFAKDGHVMGSYWPGFSLLLVPFVWCHVPWLLNPLLGAGLVWLVARWLTRAEQDEETIGWALLFLLASPVVWANSLSYYSMNARLLANLAFSYFLFSAPRRRESQTYLLAGLCGGAACFLHNPFHHLAFALPWFIALARQRRWAAWRWLALGYLPGLLLGGWWTHQLWLTHHSWKTSPLVWDAKAATELPAVTRDSVSFALLNFCKLSSWLAPGLLPLAGYGMLRARGPLRQLGFSFLSTYLIYAWVPSRWAQGFGWGHRYSYSALAALPVLAAFALRALPAKAEGERKAAALLVAAGLALALPLRLMQIREYIGEQREATQCLPSDVKQVCLINPHHGYFHWDRVQNDPFLRDPKVIMYQKTKDLDQSMLRRFYPDYELTVSTEAYQVWTPKK